MFSIEITIIWSRVANSVSAHWMCKYRTVINIILDKSVDLDFHNYSWVKSIAIFPTDWLETCICKELYYVRETYLMVPSSIY